jgi:transposase
MTNHTFKTGLSREQPSFLPPCVDDYVGRDNPVRAVDAFVDALDLEKLGFHHPGSESGAGQPPYDPADLLKLYLYGYLHRIRSSRMLERAACCNLELIWLLKGLQPGYRTIAKFRKDNATALKAANREFILIARRMGLIGGERVAIDGAFFNGNASKRSIKTRRKLAERLAAIEQEIEAYHAAMNTNDAAEDAQAATAGSIEVADMAERMAALMSKRTQIQADLASLKEAGETQISDVDEDARLLSKNGQVIAGYNVQIAVDDKHKLIVASDVVNDSNDAGQLHKMAKAAKEELGAETLAALADGGYYNSNELKACEENGIVAYVPEPKRTGRVGGKGRLSHEQFTFDVENNVYRCPGGRVLTPTKGRKVNGGRIEIRYTSRKSDCDACPLRVRCLSPKTPTRTVQRWEHESVLERHRARMKNAEAQMRRRAELAEHPFGTLKCRAGYCHFLVRGFEKVRGEWSLMALCYNFSRVLNIIGLKKLIAHLMKRAANLRFLSLQGALALAIVGPRMALRAVFPRQSARAVGCLIRGACSDRFLPGLFVQSGLRIRGNCQNQRSLTVTVSPGRTGAICGTFCREVTPDAERLMSASKR